jgi:threonyl-tRNA synthetase
MATFSEYFTVTAERGWEPVEKASALAHPALAGNANLEAFVANELGYRSLTASGDVPRHIEYMRRHELVGQSPTSEKGHLEWYPNGVMMQRLLLAYADQVAADWGAVEMMNPMLIRGDQNEVGMLMGEFHERDYRVDGGRGVGFLRYASDPLAFPFMSRIKVDASQMPLRVYERANCFRNEQEGEVSGLKRMRWFIMTDMHAASIDEDQALTEYRTLTERFGQLMDDIIAPGAWVLGWEIVAHELERKKGLIHDLTEMTGVPSFVKVMPEMTHYYAFKNEFQVITSDRANVQVSTVQWDTKNAKRFNIGYLDGSEKKPAEVIIHASSIGSVERALCGVLETIAIAEDRGETPQFPLWLAPSQVRVIPIREDHHAYAEQVVETLMRSQVRADLDDSRGRLNTMVRSAETSWVPYTVVIGDREVSEEVLNVRMRSNRVQQKMTLAELTDEIATKTEGKPFERSSLPYRLSMRPSFI